MFNQLLLFIPLASAFQNIAFLVTIHLVALGFLHLPRRRLLTPHPSANPRKISAADLDSVSYDDIDMLMAIPRQATNEGYAVIGGSGYVGKYVQHLLQYKICILTFPDTLCDCSSYAVNATFVF